MLWPVEAFPLVSTLCTGYIRARPLCPLPGMASQPLIQDGHSGSFFGGCSGRNLAPLFWQPWEQSVRCVLSLALRERVTDGFLLIVPRRMLERTFGTGLRNILPIVWDCFLDDLPDRRFRLFGHCFPISLTVVGICSVLPVCRVSLVGRIF